jgi:hypothetical protein
MFIWLDFSEKERINLVRSDRSHTLYSAYILLFLLHNQYHHTKVSRGDTTLVKERL